MELQPINNQQELAQRETTAKFVHDAADMEMRAFTMRKAAEKLKKELETDEEKEKQKVELAKRKLEVENENLNHVEWEKKYYYNWYLSFFFKNPEHYPTIRWLIWPTIVFLFALTISAGTTGASIVTYSFIAAYAFILLIWNIVFGIIYLVHKKRKLRDIEWRKSYVKECADDLKQKEEEYNYFMNVKFANGMKRVEELNTAANEIDELLSKCYELNVVKPSYQNLVCLLIMDNIFMNDKADTMREAMLLCDTELRHSELIGKLDKVADALYALSNSLQGIDRVLNSIDTNISHISRDANRMTDAQEQIAYATESLQKSAENTDFFIAQRRAGMI